MSGGSAGNGLVSSRVVFFETAPRQEPTRRSRSSSRSRKKNNHNKHSNSRSRSSSGVSSRKGRHHVVVAHPDDSRVDAEDEDLCDENHHRDLGVPHEELDDEDDNHHRSHHDDEENIDDRPHRQGGNPSFSSVSVSSIKRKKNSKQSPSSSSQPLPISSPEPLPKNENGEEGEETIGSELTESGLEHYQKGEFSHAQKAFSTVLKTQSLSVGCEDISVAVTLGNLGAVFLKQERLLEAERALEESLAMKKRLAEAVPVVLADTLNNLGNCANLRGDFDESLKYYHQALSELRENEGRRAQVANLLFNIGRLEIQRREWDNALDALSEAWRMTRDVWGNSHVYVAQTLDLLGFVQISTKQYDSAIISFTGALSIYRRINGPLHPDVASALFNVGMVREARGDLDDALEAYKTARDLHIRLDTPEEDAGFTTVRHSIASMQKSVTQKKLATLVAKHQGTLLEKKKQSGLA